MVFSASDRIQEFYEKSPGRPWTLADWRASIDDDVILGLIAERQGPGTPLRAGLETWARKNIPALLKEGNASGNIVGAFTNLLGRLQVLVSQKEADLALGERATGSEATAKAVENALVAGDVKAALEAEVFFLLKWNHWRNLQHPDIQRLVRLARETADVRLFIRLGRALEEKPIKGPDALKIADVPFVLVALWLRGPNGQIGLCRLTDEALTKFCRLALGRDDLTVDKIRKARQRLGLRKGPEPWLNKVEKTKDGIVISLDE